MRGDGSSSVEGPGPEPAAAGPGPEPVAEGPGAEPTAEELERIAVPATVRRAPRYRRFVLTGVLVGVVAALVVVLALGRPGAEVSRATVLPFVAFGLVLLGALLGALVAVLADRSRR